MIRMMIKVTAVKVKRERKRYIFHTCTMHIIHKIKTPTNLVEDNGIDEKENQNPSRSHTL